MAADRYFGLAFIAIAAGMFFATLQITAPFDSLGDPGPTILPFLLSAGFAIFGVLLALRPTSKLPQQNAEEAAAETEGDVVGSAGEAVAPPPVAVRLAIALALVAYVTLFERLGFTVATFLFLAVTMVLLGPRAPRGVAASVALAALLTLAVGGILSGIVGVPLPGVWIP